MRLGRKRARSRPPVRYGDGHRPGAVDLNERRLGRMISTRPPLQTASPELLFVADAHDQPVEMR